MDNNWQCPICSTVNSALRKTCLRCQAKAGTDGAEEHRMSIPIARNRMMTNGPEGEKL